MVDNIMMKQQNDNTRIIYSFLGPPGSGKGTLAKNLVLHKGFLVLSTGNLCRKHIASETDFGKQLNEYISKGELVPDQLITAMVIDWLETKQKGQAPIILDGFPRTSGQAQGLLDFFKKASSTYTFKPVLIELSEEEIVKRLSQRLLCSNKNCQTPFSIAENLKNCKVCGGILIKRDDDKKEVVLERLKLYPAHRDSLLSFYQSIGLEIKKIDTIGLSQDQVFESFESTCL